MEPPIPNPSSAPKPAVLLEKGPRPEALIVFIGISLIFPFVGLLIPAEPDPNMSRAAHLILFAVIQSLWLTVLWFLWAGRNWARITVMIFCSLGLVSLMFLGQDQGRYALARQIHTVLDCIFGLFWFWWLRSPAVVEFYKGKTT